MISIREEIRSIEMGKTPREGNVLKRSPHTRETLMASEWDRPYTREMAAFPMVSPNREFALSTIGVFQAHCHDKLWPSVGRVDDQYGDRNLVCTCPPVEAYSDL